MFFLSFGFSSGNPHPRINPLVYHRGPIDVNPCLTYVALMQQPMINNGLRLVVHLTTKVFLALGESNRSHCVQLFHAANYAIAYVHQCTVQRLSQCHTTEKHKPLHRLYKRRTEACKFQAMVPPASLESLL